MKCLRIKKRPHSNDDPSTLTSSQRHRRTKWKRRMLMMKVVLQMRLPPTAPNTFPHRQHGRHRHHVFSRSFVRQLIGPLIGATTRKQPVVVPIVTTPTVRADKRAAGPPSVQQNDSPHFRVECSGTTPVSGADATINISSSTATNVHGLLARTNSSSSGRTAAKKAAASAGSGGIINFFASIRRSWILQDTLNAGQLNAPDHGVAKDHKNSGRRSIVSAEEKCIRHTYDAACQQITKANSDVELLRTDKLQSIRTATAQSATARQRTLATLSTQLDQLEYSVKLRNTRLAEIHATHAHLRNKCEATLAENERELYTLLSKAHASIHHHVHRIEQQFVREIQPRNRERNRLFISLAQDIEQRHLKRDLLMKLLDALVFGLHRMQDYINLGFQQWIDSEQTRHRIIWFCIVFTLVYWFVLPVELINAVSSFVHFWTHLIFAVVGGSISLIFGTIVAVIKHALLMPYYAVRFSLLTVPLTLNAAGQAISNALLIVGAETIELTQTLVSRAMNETVWNYATDVVLLRNA